MSIAENVARVRDRIAATARRAGRNPMEIALMAVTKTHPPERIREAYAAGLRLFGENRVQEFASKADKLRDLEAILQAAPSLTNLQFRGLMTIPPFTENPEDARPYFCQLHALRDEIAAQKLPAIRMDVLSMGMSHDFEVAIEEGSTCVRVGTAIFGERTRA